VCAYTLAHGHVYIHTHTHTHTPTERCTTTVFLDQNLWSRAGTTPQHGTHWQQPLMRATFPLFQSDLHSHTRLNVPGCQLFVRLQRLRNAPLYPVHASQLSHWHLAYVHYHMTVWSIYAHLCTISKRVLTPCKPGVGLELQWPSNSSLFL
jgi:hypothetical protein